MIEHKTCHMANGFRPQLRSRVSGRAGTDDHQISSPCCGTLDDFMFRSSLTLQQLCSGKIALSFLQDILGRGFFCLTHLLAPCRREFGSAEKPFALSFHLAMRPDVNDVEETERE